MLRRRGEKLIHTVRRLRPVYHSITQNETRNPKQMHIPDCGIKELTCVYVAQSEFRVYARVLKQEEGADVV
jgi:hypothetical protein